MISYRLQEAPDEEVAILGSPSPSIGLGRYLRIWEECASPFPYPHPTHPLPIFHFSYPQPPSSLTDQVQSEASQSLGLIFSVLSLVIIHSFPDKKGSLAGLAGHQPWRVCRALESNVQLSHLVILGAGELSSSKPRLPPLVGNATELKWCRALVLPKGL